MVMLPFMLDWSTIAGYIRSIGSIEGRETGFVELLDICRNRVDELPYHYLEQILKRTELALPQARTDEERQVLSELSRLALWRIQRVGIENP